ncbi:hypothetical protein MBEHAL_0384 [Halarchaeum acidiphilum MH1-52-1]|uniref:Uncharacterized protein n=1 Tax=Halarchaeum acidiphilum MH1-52-1 TaxID=1261545 RepID=U3A1U3_9EURY|nr:hypothetical protein [Halarchaeum acidiphilum]GAD51624.1 hypothetical protein MBEHAL_0384 [Halarchaeum acidiphilum MH1-52-1]
MCHAEDGGGDDDAEECGDDDRDVEAVGREPASEKLPSAPGPPPRWTM